jgi:hypothetical protein
MYPLVGRFAAVVQNLSPNSAGGCRRCSRAVRATGQLYFDLVTKVIEADWARGRTAVVGDASSSVSLFGDGTTLAMAGAQPRHPRCHIPRDFVPWRFSDAGRISVWLAQHRRAE